MSIRSLIRSGVPQGSILGPLLFLLFINDLPLLLKHCQADFFADDATAHTSNPNIEAINTELQSDFSGAISWSKQNKLPINYDKTKYMVLGSKESVQDEYQLVLRTENHTIDKVSTQKLLGIFIDDHLSWNSNIDHLVQRYLLKSRFLNTYQHTCLKTYKKYTTKALFHLCWIMAAIPGEQHLVQI